MGPGLASLKSIDSDERRRPPAGLYGPVAKEKNQFITCVCRKITIKFVPVSNRHGIFSRKLGCLIQAGRANNCRIACWTEGRELDIVPDNAESAEHGAVVVTPSEPLDQVRCRRAPNSARQRNLETQGDGLNKG